VKFIVRIASVLILALPALIASADDTLSTAEVMDALQESDWRQPDPANLLYMQLGSGTVIMELAPAFAPQGIANIKLLVNEKYFDGLAIIRSQDNYVVQWGDPAAEDETARPIGSAEETVAPEFERSVEGIEIVPVESRDAYASAVGFANGFPTASDGRSAWLTHCYGMVGVARGDDVNSGNGTSLYVITGHAPRHLDRNVTLVGRVISGIEHLAVLRRGTRTMGFYDSIDAAAAIISVRLGNDVADQETSNIEIMRTDTKAFKDYVMSKMYRFEEWFVEPTGRIEICNINPPARTTQ